jgi:hypothetical protein
LGRFRSIEIKGLFFSNFEEIFESAIATPNEYEANVLLMQKIFEKQQKSFIRKR